jgi:phosphate transport system permease protein
MNARTESLAGQDFVRRSLEGKRLDAREVLFQATLIVALLASLLILVVLLFDVARTGGAVLSDRGVDFFRQPLSNFSPDLAGVSQAVFGSLASLLFVIVLAIPLGVGAAVYLEEFARDTRLNRLINVNIRNLAGVPSIVYGLLGLALFVELLGGVTGGKTIISAGLTLGVLVLPIVIITSAEALRAVPGALREAGYGVGATRWEVIRHHVLPSAAPGIMTGIVLSLARALGETAPILLVGAVTGFLASGGAGFAEQLRQPFTTLPVAVYAWSQLPQDEFRALASAAIVVLLVVILIANGAAILLRNRYERKW